MNGTDRDELNRPLGAPPPVAAANAAPSQPSRAGRSLVALTLGGVMALLGGAGVWFAQRHENERIRNDVAALMERQAATPAAPASPASGEPAGPVVEGTDPAPTGSTGPSGLNPGVRVTGKEIENASGVRVVRAGDGEPEDRETPGAMVIKVPQAATITLAPAPDRRLTENGKHGVLPRRGADGASAMNIYARPVATPASLSSSAPRIAIMVGGMGLSQNATRAAISRLPPEVTLGFAPYGQGLAGQVAYARSRGHEVILQAPMEAIGIGDAPGPRMLQSSDGPAQTLDNLHWLMSRFHGYAGVANFLGARFLGDAKALAPVIN
ncbi:MAG: hypothetical protein FJX29_10455, partial [Alphaproteobacteria bacterium]|nr:hypothetical protein [Alphaproteobacteria bacterium]